MLEPHMLGLITVKRESITSVAENEGNFRIWFYVIDYRSHNLLGQKNGFELRTKRHSLTRYPCCQLG